VTQGLSAPCIGGASWIHRLRRFSPDRTPPSTPVTAGTLLNLYGEVIGVNAVIATQSGGFEGIGFTIPSNMALYVSKALIAHGKVERDGWGSASGTYRPDQLARTP